MKKIMLFGPTIVAGAIRHPYENPLTVTNKEAARLVAAGVLAADPQDTDGEDPVEPPEETGDGLDAMLVDDLKALAARETVDLTGISRKDDIITAIREHRAANPA